MCHLKIYKIYAACAFMALNAYFSGFCLNFILRPNKCVSRHHAKKKLDWNYECLNFVSLFCLFSNILYVVMICFICSLNNMLYP